MRRLVLLPVLAMVAAVAPPAQGDTVIVIRNGAPPMVSGTARVDGGVWTYTDFVYDDYGADTAPAGSSNRVTLASSAGDYRYPDDARYAGNAADVGQVRAAVVGDDLEITIELVTLVDAAAPAVGIALDAGSGVEAEWPAGANVTSVWDQFLYVADGSARRSYRLGLASVDELPATVDLEANTITVTVPGLGALDEVGISVGAGLHDPANGVFMGGSPAGALDGTYNAGLGIPGANLFDLAFNTRDIEPRYAPWGENAQSRALAEGRAYSQTIELDELRSGITYGTDWQPGLHNVVFRSIQDLGEGAGSSFPTYRSRLQPYALWVPDDLQDPTPFHLNLHSLSVHHNQYRGGPPGGATSYFTMYEQLADSLDNLVATPLARGPDGWYRNEALVDALEVYEDVHARFNVDPDRRYLSGYSMGGYGTYRIGTLLADRFAAAVSWAGVPTDTDRLENMRHVPTMIVHGTNDELVPIQGVRDQAARLDELGHEYRFHEHPGQDHLSFVWLDEWSREREWLDGRTRVAQPATVTFDVRPSMWTTGKDPAERAEILGHVEALGADLRSSYWVRGVHLRDDAGTAEVRATSLAISTRDPQVTDVSGVALAPNTPHITEGNDVVLGELPTENRLEIGLANTADVTIDASGAGLDTTDVLYVSATVDGPTTLRIDGGFAPGTIVDEVNGRDLDWSLVDGVVILELTRDAQVAIQPA